MLLGGVSGSKIIFLFFFKVDLYILMPTDTSPIWKDKVVGWIVVI